ncbi:MAG: hypothetical protein H6581_10735 [Bacteroidia bacterium]|nr:hypothetical protein [Bacteroidia bacterium]
MEWIRNFWVGLEPTRRVDGWPVAGFEKLTPALCATPLSRVRQRGVWGIGLVDFGAGVKPIRMADGLRSAWAGWKEEEVRNCGV